jgi:hypothetical protein
MEPSQTSDTAPTEPARKPSWIMRGTFLLGGGLWLLYPVAPQVFGLMQGEPIRWVYLWAWLPMWLFVGLAWGIHKQLQAAEKPANKPTEAPNPAEAS